MAKITDTNEHEVGQKQAFVLPTTGKLDRNDFHDEFATVDTPNWENKAKMLAFMEETVEIIISDSDRDNAEQVIQLNVNGINQFLFRGIPCRIKRKFVEVLARARPEAISTPEFIDVTGNRATKILKTMGLKYPFRVLTDSQDGHRWVESLLREQN